MKRLILAGLTCLTALCAVATPAQNAATLRIGIAMPEAQLGQGNNGQDVAEPIRQLLMSYMAGPQTELVVLQSRIPAQLEAEARQQNCAYVLVTRVSQKKASKGMGGALGMLGSATSMLGGGGAGNTAAIAGMANQMVAQQAAQSAQQDAMASLTQAQSGTVKAKDEVSMLYRFFKVGSLTPVLEETLKAKATQDGEDLLSPLAEQVATKTVTLALTPQG